MKEYKASRGYFRENEVHSKKKRKKLTGTKSKE